MAAGFVLFLALSAFAFLAATAVARRASYDGRAECLLAVFMLWSTIILAPIHALGLTGTLTRSNLALASAAVSAVVFVAASGARWRERGIDAIRTIGEFFTLPIEALAIAWRARSLLFLAILATFAVLAWTAWLSYLAPSDAWDSLWYHETMVGFAIQNHGYRIVEASPILTPVNVFPRNCEMTSLWFVFFTDRRWIDIINDVYALPVMLAMYCLTKRYAGNRLHAIGWACSLVLMPGFALQLRSSYIDIHALSFYLAALHFGTRPNLRLRDGWMAAMCLGLLLGAKSFALAWTPVLAMVTLIGLLPRHLRKRRAATIATVAGGVVLIVALGGIIYIRNWVHFHNPIWPYRLDLPKLGISFPGTEPLSSTEFHRPYRQMLEDILSVPSPGYDYPDTKKQGYGMAVPFLVLPLAMAAVPWIAFEGFAALMSRRTGETKSGDSGVGNLLLTVLAPLTSAFHSPALWLSRYNFHVVAGLLIVLSWVGRRLPRLAEGTTVACAVTGLMWLYWAKPAWFCNSTQAMALARMKPDERVAFTGAGWSIAPEVALAREHELGPGDVVAFTDDSEFYSQLWNERFSNLLVYVPMGPADDVMQRLEQVRAKWFVTRALAVPFDASSKWQRVGNVSSHPVAAFRRVPPP
jgi:hypothetical protein